MRFHRWLKQIGLILLLTLIGEILHHLIPLNIPAGIYGILLLFLLLLTGILKLDSIKGICDVLIGLMPIMFVPAAVGLMQNAGLLAGHLPAYVVMIVVSTVLVMASAGWAAQLLRRMKGGNQDE